MFYLASQLNKCFYYDGLIRLIRYYWPNQSRIRKPLKRKKEEETFQKSKVDRKYENVYLPVTIRSKYVHSFEFIVYFANRKKTCRSGIYLSASGNWNSQQDNIFIMYTIINENQHSITSAICDCN